MIYSRSAEYAIRAFVYLAEVPPGKFAMVKQIAQSSKTPSHFLAKILQQMARKGFLQSSKGPTGGFALRQPASKITLLQIVDSVDSLSEYYRCPGGLEECNDDMPCGLHDSWMTLRSRIIGYLETTSIADVVVALDLKRKALAMPAKTRKTAAKKKA